MIERELLMKFVAAGITASSPDNSQPFTFRLLPTGIELGLDRSRLGMFFDADGYASMLGCGGVIECIRLCAAYHGYRTEVTPTPGAAAEGPCAILQFLRGDVSKDPLADAITERCSYRGFFTGDQVATPVIEQIEASLTPIPGAHIQWFSQASRAELTRIISATDRLRYTHQRLHQDFHSKLRFGSAIETRRDGLAANTLGIETVFTWLLPLFKSWPLSKACNLLGMHYFMAWRGATLPLNNAAEIGALILPKTTDPLEQGRALQRLWLAINANPGLHCQIFGALPLFIYRLQECGGDGFEDHQQAFLQEHVQRLETLIEGDLDSQRIVVMFRLGYPRQKVVRSLRRPLDSFILTSD